MAKEIKPNIEKSEQQADILLQIALPVMFLDTDYCIMAAKDMMTQASKQESMAVLNPNHSQTKNDILRAKGIALQRLCDYVDALKNIEKLNSDLKIEAANQEKIKKLFSF